MDESPLNPEKKKTERPVVEKIVTGEVKQKSKGIAYKFKSLFMGGDIRLAGNYVVADILFPALRNLVVDMVSRGTERLVFGESLRRRPSEYRGRQEYTSYNRFYDPRDRDRDPRPQLMPSRLPDQRSHRVNRKDIPDIIIGSREEADAVVEQLFNYLSMYDIVGLDNLYNLVGIQTSYIDQHWGWTDLRGTEVRQVREGYLIELPPLESI